MRYYDTFDEVPPNVPYTETRYGFSAYVPEPAEVMQIVVEVDGEFVLIYDGWTFDNDYLIPQPQ